ncbi:MAG: metal-dependent hydrolase [Caulobacterales bacterium]
MKVRRPKFDFSNTPAHWAPVWEYAQTMNGSSAWIPYLERFLNRVMADAAAKLDQNDPASAQLRNDIRTFVRQEANHYALHGAFNAILARHGYDITPFERHFEAEFERLYTTKSFAFQLAYCEGFETLGPPAALVWLDEIEDLLEGADAEVVGLWKWHLMEEYEHRTVCHDAFHHFHGGYWLRLYGFFYQLAHLGRFSKMVREYLLEKDRAAMTPEARAESIKRQKRVGRRIAGLVLPRLLKVLSPFYTPRNSPEPRMFKSHMEKVEAAL